MSAENPSEPKPSETSGKDQDDTSETSWTFLLIGVTLVLIILSAAWLGPIKKKSPGPNVPQLTPAMVPLVTGEEPIEKMFAQAGCPVCHTIQGIHGAEGRVGPKLALGTNGPRRLADPRYHGDARTVREYVIESILRPGAYVVRGYPDRIMPTWYGEKLSAAALEKIAAYLESLTDDDPAVP